MKYLLLLLSVTMTLSACKESPKTDDISGPGAVTYPPTATVDQQDNYFGTTIADPYRWLENEGDSAVTAWIEQQNDVTFGYLEQIPYRSQME